MEDLSVRNLRRLRVHAKNYVIKEGGGYDVIFSVLKMTFPVDCGQSLRRAKV